MKTTKKSASSKATTKKDSEKPERKVKRASKKIMSAASQLKKTTKKLVDDVFLKVVGLRVLERAKQMTESLHKEDSAAKQKNKKSTKKGGL